MLLLLDNYDSFTYNLKDYFEQLGVSCLTVRNDEITLEKLKKRKFKGIVISPGPKTPQDAGILMEVIAEYHDKLPILGICLGHQALGEYFGADLVKSGKPHHGKESVITHTGHPMYANLAISITVCRYHSLELKNIPDSIDVTAKTADNTIMSISHKTLPLWGIQFHPEAILTQGGLTILKNWLNIVF